jgi:hypothetical protein
MTMRSITSMDPIDINYDWNDAKREVRVTCDRFPDLALNIVYKAPRQSIIRLTPEAKLILDRASLEKQEQMEEQLTLLKSFALSEVEKHFVQSQQTSQGEINASVNTNKHRIKVTCKGQFKGEKGVLTLKKMHHKPEQISSNLSKKSELYSLLKDAAEKSLAAAKNTTKSKHHHK